ncbi:MAG TPA: DUF1707 domain-containing protein [Pilimelia sp.]|nr:DUF1707 domain-containing protein [Pilimelia sp.]
MESALRASDADRQQVVAELERHTAAGRLTLDEFDERVALALAALTRGDLAAVTHDLPAEPPAPTADPHHAGARQLAAAFLLATLTLVVLAILFAVLR